jgi:hypothetical protein
MRFKLRASIVVWGIRKQAVAAWAGKSMKDKNPVSAPPSSGGEGGVVGEDCLSGECNFNRLHN